MRRCPRPYVLLEENIPTPDEWREWALQCAPLHELLRRVRESMQEVAHGCGVVGDPMASGGNRGRRRELVADPARSAT